MSDFKTFVVPFDFSDHARAALFTAADLARRLSADLHLVHVIQPPTYVGGYGTAPPPHLDLSELHDTVSKSLREVAEGIEGLAGAATSQVVEDLQIAQAISDVAAERKADLIVMGTHGRTGLAHVFLGSVAERTLRLAPCPVLTVKGSETEDAGSA